MHFTSLAFASLVATATASALPEAIVKTDGGLHKRADFDPVAACRRFQPSGGETCVVSTISHNIIYDPIDGIGSGFENGAAIVLDFNCLIVGVEDYEPRGSGNGFSAMFSVPFLGTTVDMETRVATLGDPFGIADSQWWLQGVEKERVFCSGTQNIIEGLDVDSYSVCNFLT